MRASFSDRVERGRIRAGRTEIGSPFGAFRLATNTRAELTVIVSRGTNAIPWDHVSVSLRDRCPTWPEMAWVKSLFFEDDEAVIQFHPPKSDYVNHHPYCLHLWRPTRDTVPLPPAIAVGPVGEEKDRLAKDFRFERQHVEILELFDADEHISPATLYEPWEDLVAIGFLTRGTPGRYVMTDAGRIARDAWRERAAAEGSPR